MFKSFTSILLFVSFACFAQKEYKVMEWKTEYTLNTYLVQQMKLQYAERARIFATALKSKESLLAYGKNVRQKFRELIGPLPPVSPLNAKVTGTSEFDEYAIQKIVYESFPNHHVTANLYIPGGGGKKPAIIFFCGHEDVSKATESYQQAALQFMRDGFVVMVIDPVSQSERHQLTGANGKPLTRGGTTEHTLINETANLVGSSAPAYELWDNVRGLDYLVTRPEVDSSKIGCFGNSGGAIQAIYFAAYDPRVKVIVPCSYLSSRERTLELTGPADGCAQIPGEGKALLEMSDYLISAAPKPILVLAGRYDFIDYEGTMNSFNDLKQAYNVLGQPQKLKLFVYDDGHGISAPKREEASAWFKKWLLNDTSEIMHISNFKLETGQSLMVTSKGQVNAEFPNEVTVFERNSMLADSLGSSRRAFLQRADARKKIIEQINISSVTVEHTGFAKKGDWQFDKLIFRRDNEPPLPALNSPPQWETGRKKMVLWFHDGGKQHIMDSAALLQSYYEQHAILIAADVRGVGETEDKAEFNDPKYFNREYRNAMLALHTGRPLVLQRAADILTILSLIRQRMPNDLPVEIHASGHVALAALYAALADDKISKLYLYDCISSFTEILNNPLKKDWYSWVVPNALKYYDIPDLIKLVGEGKVVIVK